MFGPVSDAELKEQILRIFARGQTIYAAVKMSVFSLSADCDTHFDNQMQVYCVTLDAYLGAGDFVIMQLFDQTEEVVGRVIDVKNSLSEIPESEQNDADVAEGTVFLVRLWPFVSEDTMNTDRLLGEDEILTWRIQEVMEGDA